MSSYNRVTLIGNLTRQPELRKTKNGATVTDLGLALNRIWNGEDGQRHEETTFVDVTVWGRAAENAAKYLQKGRSVLVEGRLHMDSWQDKETGQDRSRLKVVADSLQFLGAHQQSTSPGEAHREEISKDHSREQGPNDGDRRASSRGQRRYEAA